MLNTWAILVDVDLLVNQADKAFISWGFYSGLYRDPDNK